MDLSITSTPAVADQCKQLRNQLWRTLQLDKKDKLPADVEFVFGGHKIKIIIDVSQIKGASNLPASFRKGLKQYPRRAVALFLEGIECTRATKNRSPKQWTETDALNDQVATWAKNFVEGLINQREVKVRFTKVDKQGNFLGTIHVPNPQRSLERSVVWMEVGSDGKPTRQNFLMDGERGKEVNLAEMLLRRGLAKCRTILRGADVQSLIDAEQIAKNGKVGYWRHYTPKAAPETPNGKKAEEAAPQPQPTAGKVKVTHVTNGAELFAISLNDRTAAAEQEIAAGLKNYPPKDGSKPKEFDPENRIFSKNMIVAGRFMNGYYRCKILDAQRREPKPDMYRVHFIDYGNDSYLEYADIEFLPQNLKPPKLPSLARTYRLAFLKAPNQDQQGEIYQQAGEMLSDKTLEQEFTITMLNSPLNDSNVHIILDEGKDSDSINELLVAKGLCRVEGGVIQRYRKRGGGGRRRGGSSWPGPKETGYLDKVLEKERRAKQLRSGMHHYGDVDSDNDDD